MDWWAVIAGLPSSSVFDVAGARGLLPSFHACLERRCRGYVCIQQGLPAAEAGNLAIRVFLAERAPQEHVCFSDWEKVAQVSAEEAGLEFQHI